MRPTGCAATGPTPQPPAAFGAGDPLALGRAPQPRDIFDRLNADGRRIGHTSVYQNPSHSTAMA